MELAVDDNRIDWVPQYYNNCPEYWKRFIDNEAHNTSPSFRDTLIDNYNVEWVGKIHDPNYNDRYSFKVIFNTREDLFYFKLRWS